MFKYRPFIFYWRFFLWQLHGNRQIYPRIREAPLPLSGSGANCLYKVHSGTLHSAGAAIGRNFSAQLSSFSASLGAFSNIHKRYL